MYEDKTKEMIFNLYLYTAMPFFSQIVSPKNLFVENLSEYDCQDAVV